MYDKRRLRPNTVLETCMRLLELILVIGGSVSVVFPAELVQLVTLEDFLGLLHLYPYKDTQGIWLT